MKIFYWIILLVLVSNCDKKSSMEETKKNIATAINAWHLAASEANFNSYFGLMTNDAVFIGTDATENWNRKDFETFAKPYFDRGKAWHFVSLEKNIYLSKDQQTAWFDELLETSFQICRGSGVMIKENQQWKMQHYVLSMTIPNEISDTIVQLKSKLESTIIQKLKKESLN